MTTRTKKNDMKRARGLLFGTLLLFAVAAGWLALPGSVWRQVEPTAYAALTFVVTTTGDDADVTPGDQICDSNPSPLITVCTLRAAIQEANALPGADTINFNIAGSGVRTISPTSALPEITEQVTINGFSQPGTSSNTLADGNNAIILIELKGVNAGSAIGLRVSASNCVVKGMSIVDFNSSAILISGDANTIEGNLLGLTPTGVSISNKGDGVFVGSNSKNNLVGGTTPAARNVISGNDGDGVGMFFTGTGNQVQGNFIGVALDGSSSSPNSGFGVRITAAPGNTIGGSVSGARNVISSNTEGGILIALLDSVGNKVQGNYIGTDSTGALDRGNAGNGVVIRNTAHDNLVGGIIAAERNVISGNEGSGVLIIYSGTMGNNVQGNYIGTDKTGGIALGNATCCSDSGVRIESGASDNLVGGTVGGAANLISGNKSVGITIYGSGTDGNQIQGNFIGTNSLGHSALANSSDGVVIAGGAKNNTVGGTAPAARNLISGNGAFGVQIATTTGNKIQGNFIGTDNSGTMDLGNKHAGVGVLGASGNTIGGDAGNFIAFNAQGVRVSDFGGDKSVNNLVSSNHIHSNTGLGIDLASDGITANDGSDADPGPNNLQNFPILTSANNSGGATLINGTLNSTPNMTFHIQVFSNQTCDPSGHGEGHLLIDTEDAMTNASGNLSFTAAAPTSSLSGQFITATATDPAGNTSEFSQCRQLSTPMGSLQFGQASYFVQEDCAEVIVSVSRTGDSSNAATVDYATANGTASERSDFTTARGILRFAAGETARSFSILITEDSRVEGSENFAVTLNNASGATIGSPTTATVDISDDSPEQTSNPVDVAEQFVCQHYHDFLNREDDLAGLNFWTNEIESCGADIQCREVKRVNVSGAFFLSIEFQETGGLVIRAQRAAFGKKSDTAGLRVSYNQFIEESREVGEGVVVLTPGWEQKLEANRQLYVERIVRTADFINKYPLSMTAEAYVDSLIATSGLALTSAERQAAINAFGGGGTTGRAASLRKVADSETLRAAEFRPAFVLMQYFGYLRRNPTDAPDSNDNGYQFWLAKLNAFNGDFAQAEMVKAFILSTEYRSRFGAS